MAEESGVMDGVKVAMGSRGMTVETALHAMREI